MRVIKFKGKKKSDGNWIIGELNQFDRKVFIFNRDDNGDNLINPDDYEVHPNTVGQFTGLKDKNGVDIYEGDVVVFSDNKINHIVEYRTHAFVLTNKGSIYCYNWVGDILEVTGNIHDLKQQDESI